MSRWFRFYEGVLDDPKVQRLPPDVFKGWVNLLCLAARHKGKLPSLPDIAFSLRISDREAESLMTALLGAGLVDDVGDSMQPHKWYERQYEDTTNAERQRKFRERKKAEKSVTRYASVTEVTDNGPVTPVEQNRTEQKEALTVPLEITGKEVEGGKRAPRKRAAARKPLTTIPDGFPGDADIRWCLEEFPKLSAWQEAERFRDRSLQHGTEWKDWTAAWRNWCRNAVRFAEERNRRFA